MQNLTIHSRICWVDFDGVKQCSRWYAGRDAAEPALAACRVRWPNQRFWLERSVNRSYPAHVIPASYE